MHEVLSTRTTLNRSSCITSVLMGMGRERTGYTNCSITFAAVSVLGVCVLDCELVLCVQV